MKYRNFLSVLIYVTNILLMLVHLLKNLFLKCNKGYIFFLYSFCSIVDNLLADESI